MGRHKKHKGAAPGIHLPEGFTGLLLSTPCYGAKLTNAYCHSLISTVTVLVRLGLPHTWLTLPDEAVISRARDLLMAWFLASKHSHMMCLDSDVQWQKEDVLKLMLCGHEVIMGSYPKKIMPEPGKPMEYPVNWIWPDDSGKLETCPKCGAIKINGGPAGFMMIRRSAAEKMFAAYSDMKYEGIGKFPDADKYLYAGYNPILEKGVLWSEDLSWCQRWRAIGGEVWLDPDIRLGHFGNYMFTGNIDELFTKVPVDEVKDDATHPAL